MAISSGQCAFITGGASGIGLAIARACSDYVWNYADTLHWVLRNPKNFPVEMGYATPSHMGKPSELWGAARVLEEVYGWTEEEIAGFLGENLTRFYSEAWKR